MIKLTINKTQVEVPEGTTVAAALLNNGQERYRLSVSGEPRGPLCGMGICFECRVTIDGVQHERSCLVVATDGMEVVTGE